MRERKPLALSDGVHPAITNSCRRMHFVFSTLAFKWGHPLHQAVDLGHIKACPDLACVAELSVTIDAEDERAKAPRLVRRRPPGDHELLPEDAFRLQHACFQVGPSASSGGRS